MAVCLTTTTRANTHIVQITVEVPNLNQNYTEEPSSINRKIVWDANKIIDFQNILTNKSDIIQEFTSELPHEPIDWVVTNFTRIYMTVPLKYSGKHTTHPAINNIKRKATMPGLTRVVRMQKRNLMLHEIDSIEQELINLELILFALEHDLTT